MLAPTFHFNCWQSSGDSLASFLVRFRGWKFDATGAVEWGAWATVHAAATLTTGTPRQSTDVDNTTDKWIGGELEVGYVNGASVDGTPVAVEYVGEAVVAGEAPKTKQVLVFSKATEISATHLFYHPVF